MNNVLNEITFAPAEYRINLDKNVVTSLLNSTSSLELDALLHHICQLLNQNCGVVIQIGKLRLSQDKSEEIADKISYALCEVLKTHGAPSEMKVEIDRPQETHVPVGFKFRNLLPHHDGGHCTYLTPSTHDVPDWNPKRRTYSNETFFTTHSHKLYQGLFVIEPGEGLSVTTYFNLIKMVKNAYLRKFNLEDAKVEDVAKWLGNNIDRSIKNQDIHLSKYLSLGAALGCEEVLDHAISVHWSEETFTQEQLDEYPELQSLLHNCPCGTCSAPAGRFYCRQLYLTLGLTLQEFRRDYEVCLPSERFDLVLGNNISILHGGFMGGKSRYFKPICMVMDDVTNSGEYEDWLSGLWRSTGDFESE
ncbi:hypothetical protein [Bacillus sp. E(2018)]|uniref:hypothetical protein n=1 Tax=Bacillus sp. E(2018) TaxID=2502239 RepID=UPI0010F59851|nr:hypothetical protein [Bacillus sp. E(2018)]